MNRVRTSLLVVDAQRGFSELCPAELPIPGGLGIVPAVNELLLLPFARVDATQDWHPPDHRSFLGQEDNLYPPHCVAGTAGADFLPGLLTAHFETIWRKGYRRDFEAYAVTAQHPGFAAFLKACGIERVVIGGLARNICCFSTARDLCREGLEVWIVEEATAGIDVPQAGLYQKDARAEADRLGIIHVHLDQVKQAMLQR